LLESETSQNVDGFGFSVMGIDRVQSLVDLSETVGHLDLFFWLHFTGVDGRNILLLLKKFESLDIAIKNVLKYWDIVSNYFLLNLKDMEVVWHLIKLTSAHCVNECSFTDTVSTDQTVLTASCETHCSFVEKSLTSSHKGDVR
jgi:hypothetical protein